MFPVYAVRTIAPLEKGYSTKRPYGLWPWGLWPYGLSNFLNLALTSGFFLRKSSFYMYTKITFVRLSVTGGQRKQFDLEPSYATYLATER